VPRVPAFRIRGVLLGWVDISGHTSSYSSDPALARRPRCARRLAVGRDPPSPEASAGRPAKESPSKGRPAAWPGVTAWERPGSPPPGSPAQTRRTWRGVPRPHVAAGPLCQTPVSHTGKAGENSPRPLRERQVGPRPGSVVLGAGRPPGLPGRTRHTLPWVALSSLLPWVAFLPEARPIQPPGRDRSGALGGGRTPSAVSAILPHSHERRASDPTRGAPTVTRPRPGGFHA
jgi:hypothetical protein